MTQQQQQQNQSPQNQKIALLEESTTFTRHTNPKGDGDILEVTVNTKLKTSAGIGHNNSQNFVIQGQDATDTLGSLKVIHNNLQLLVLKAQQEQANEEAKEAAAASEGEQAPSPPELAV